MIESWVRFSIAHRTAVFAITLLLALGAAVYGITGLRLDALPDITSNQVVVLTRAPGLTPEEVELRVTRPVETALGGMPGMEGQRSLSRYGISSVTVIFDDDVDAYRARQVVAERLATVASGLPAGVEAPELAPLTGGLGEIYHFTLTSPDLTLEALQALGRLRVAPLLRAVPGVVEVNAWGGAVGTLDVVADAARLARYGLTLDDLRAAIEQATGSVAGASLPAGNGQTLLRGVALPEDAAALGAAVVHPTAADTAMGGAPRTVRVSDVAEVVEGRLPRIGAATVNGRGEGLYIMVQMLRDANALEVVQAIHAVLPELRRVLPASVKLEMVYDRGILVGNTLRTVGTNLLEGGLLVVGVLLVMLGSLRAGLLTALVIPLAMTGALAGMVWLKVPGNLMSLGALDFGLLVDGAVVMIEAAFHHLHGLRAGSHGPETSAETAEQRRAGAIARAALGVARPVFFSVLVILLVYVPVLSLTGVDGKLFRPMAITLVLALSAALVLSLTFVPAAISLFVHPRHVPHRDPAPVRAAAWIYRPVLGFALRRPAPVLLGAVLLLAGGGVLFAHLGTTFVPQLDEGDLVIQTTREPDISLDVAVARATDMERTLLTVPEVTQVVSRIGSPAVATDIMGLEQADVFVGLAPRAHWRPGLTRDALIAELGARLDRDDPGADPAFTQPIQMRFNELLGGAVADVALSIYGDDLDQLRSLAEATVAAITDLPGAQDVMVLAPPAVSLTEVRPDALAAGRHGLSPAEVLGAVQAVQAGLSAGLTYDGALPVPIRVRLGGEASAGTVGALQVPTAHGDLIRLDGLASVREGLTPALVNHEAGERRIVVGFNVRGRDLGQVVAEAQARLERDVPLPEGYRRVWGGQSETLAAASARMARVLPAVAVGILLLLGVTFRRVGPALLVFLNVPFAGVGGVAALWLRQMPVSISAAVGLVALSGIAVLNGVVLINRVLENRAQGLPPAEAAREAAVSRMRPVLMTALVAALGFVPMMLATGVGAEVQRPLATVVVGGLVTSTLLTLVVLPTLVARLSGRWGGSVGTREQVTAAEVVAATTGIHV